MNTVEILDRSGMVSALKEQLMIDPSKTAIVGVDMHRGHLDPSVATMPASTEDCKRVITHAKDVLDFDNLHPGRRMFPRLAVYSIPCRQPDNPDSPCKVLCPLIYFS